MSIKMTDAEINKIMQVVQRKLKEQQKVEAVKEEEEEEAPIFPCWVQYPLKGFDFYISPESFDVNYEEIDLYSPHSAYEVDDDHKRRRKPLDTKYIFLSLPISTWNILKAEAKRTLSGYDARTIENIFNEVVKLRAENDRMHELILALIEREVK